MLECYRTTCSLLKKIRRKLHYAMNTTHQGREHAPILLRRKMLFLYRQKTGIFLGNGYHRYPGLKAVLSYASVKCLPRNYWYSLRSEAPKEFSSHYLSMRCAFNATFRSSTGAIDLGRHWTAFLLMYL
ncbi:hypothetical protein AVEN_89227-1 [Araneus ventricosus]|uniref:Uncharacterized protein n=1 Tax=Araneus ventricosus TaxID=182803 RepID=A0A4Y2L283_ARAVE|nr:hypothetical protein AVEN_89227-1 [Araneus ventricosus]